MAYGESYDHITNAHVPDDDVTWIWKVKVDAIRRYLENGWRQRLQWPLILHVFYGESNDHVTDNVT